LLLRWSGVFFKVLFPVRCAGVGGWLRVEGKRFGDHPMIRLKHWFGKMTAAVVLAILACIPVAMGQPVQHLSVTQPGGMPGLPVMTGIGKATNGITIMWDGPSGYYQLFKKASLKDPTWLAVGGRTNLLRKATVAATPSNAFFRVLGPSPHYLGSQACTECHGNIYSTEIHTRHPGAFTEVSFKAQGGQTNSSCLPCHTVGYGLATGFSITNKSGVFSYNTNLAGVQCENCHGPAANHAANENDPTVRPRVDLAATVCGGCHTGPMQPTYEEWSTSEHAEVTPAALQAMGSSTTNLSGCGVCHSGSVRLAMINGQNPVTLTNDYNVAITCVVCHDPHQTNAYPAQLRNALASTNNYFLTSADVATVAAFTNKYNANTNINLCAQCHNDRAAAWTVTDRAPHQSSQYNLLLGSVGELAGGAATFDPGSHAGLPESAYYSLSGTFYLTNQCVSCHMQNDDAPASAVQSHKFTMTKYDVCLNCHNYEPELLVQYVMVPAVSNRVYNLKYALDLWASTKAPPALKTAGVAPWEYTTPGGLIWQTNGAGRITGWVQVDQVSFTGPSASNQALIPDNIRKARFNLYLVLNEGSYGVHNPYFALTLLDTAYDWVLEELGY
jgi:Cytochrome c554 and c-prime/Doubled CXXCH motif (Paired_CXXCH_1)